MNWGLKLDENVIWTDSKTG